MGEQGGSILVRKPQAMAKSGRNDPCPCGSGKKYKQCCLSKSSASLLGRLPKAIKAEHGKAEELVRRWLGTMDSADSPAAPLRDVRGKKLRLVLDRFSVGDVEAVRQVRALGRTDGERVLFYDGDQWIGEADFSVPNSMVLLTPQVELSDRLRALFAAIPGLVHNERQVDELAPLDKAPSGGAGLLDFKKSFFATWLDEPNQKLDQATPRQAAALPQLRPRLWRLLSDLESKEARLPRAERFDFSPLRAELEV